VKIFERISAIVRKRPWAVVIVCLLITMLLGSGLLFLKGHVTYQSLLPQDFPSVKALNALNKKFGGISYEFVVLHAPDVTDNAVVESLIAMDDEIAADPRFNQGQVQTHLNADGAKIPVVQDYLTPFIAIMTREISSRGITIRSEERV
jgi:predicted RND superfamily exporter protein